MFLLNADHRFVDVYKRNFYYCLSCCVLDFDIQMTNSYHCICISDYNCSAPQFIYSRVY